MEKIPGESQERSGTDLTWVKSSFSYANGNCVEVAWRKAPCQNGECVEAGAGDDGLVHVRDSKNPRGGMLNATGPAWSAFLAGIRAGEFPA